MSKRRPENQITKDNYDNDDPEEDTPGDEAKPQKASADVLKNRVLLKAKRRNLETANSNNTISSIFSSFKGFSSLAGNSSSSGGSFDSSKLFSSFSSTSAANPTPFTFKMPETKDSNPVTVTKPSITETPAGEEKNENPPTKMNPKLSENLRKLNQSFFDHIKKYVTNTNDVYDFTLVCEEYISKYKKFKEMFENDEQGEKIKTNGEKEKSEPNPTNDLGFKFAPQPKTDLFKSTSATTNTTTSLFSFPTTSFPTTTGFNFGVSAIGNKDKDANDGADADNQDQEEDQPPTKVASVEHTEEDSVYSKKCKLYYKKEESFVEKGVGFLYIKLNKDDKDKPAQLLVRADTNTGTILLNIALIESLPITKAEKGKGVLITCVPNPPLEVGKKKDSEEDKKTVTFLIRVKTTDCDELYENLIKYQKSSAKQQQE